ncbi:PhzF family phenazine biosynthesis protein [Bacteroidota bacterium]
MRLKLYQIDAFTEKPFTGNPAAVVPLPSWIPDHLLQYIALENNLSETAFFVKTDSKYEIRWFTPEQEVDLCGHATLATAYVIFNSFDPENDDLSFHSKSGPLNVFRNENEMISLNFPSRKPEHVAQKQDFTDCFNKEPISVWKSRDYLFEYSNEQEIINLQPEFDVISNLDCLGLIVTAKGKKYDFVSRFFAPKVGIPEDPVTGSAHSTLIPFWSEKLNKDVLTAYQCSTRGGELFCENIGDRVIISGRAVQYLEGEIDI